MHPWLSNHGGRQLDGAPSALETLLEIRANCPDIFDKCEVIVDGGLTRGADIVKALALGAKCVGIGRPFLYALSFGQAGVSKAIMILQQEIETTMALLGVETIAQLGPEYVGVSYYTIRTTPFVYVGAFIDKRKSRTSKLSDCLTTKVNFILRNAIKLGRLISLEFCQVNPRTAITFWKFRPRKSMR